MKITGYEIFIAVLSMLSLVNLGWSYVADDPGIQDVLTVINWLLSGVFLIDFSYRIITAPPAAATSSAASVGPISSSTLPFGK